MERISGIAKLIGWPGLVSLLSLFAAWSAICLLLAGNYRFAILSSVAAFLLDTIDGFLARKLGVVSEFGRQLDGMIDAVNYSVFGALVVSQVLIPNALGFVVAFFMLAFGIIRLILFNINGYTTDGETLYYLGVVTPHLTLAVALLAFVNKIFGLNEWLMALVLMLLAIGQLSTIKTRKTGAIVFWLPMSIAIAVGALLWF